jgi:hypothetical protein
MAMFGFFAGVPVSADPSDEIPPAPPWGLTATPGEDGVHLAWNAPATNGGTDIQAYVIYRTQNGFSFEVIAHVETRFYVDHEGGVDGVYAYAVTAVSDAGESMPTLTGTASSGYPRCDPFTLTPIPDFYPDCLIPSMGGGDGRLCISRAELRYTACDLLGIGNRP